jgi:hypothetical protein
LKGPKFLLSNVISIPDPADHIPNNCVKFNKCSSFAVTVVSKPLHIVANLYRFSLRFRLFCATARADQLLRQEDTPCTRRGPYPLCASDWKSAEIHYIFIMKPCQAYLSPNHLENLSSKVDAHGLLRLEGRITAASGTGVSERIKQPIIRDGGPHISRLLVVRQYHIWAGHGGRESVINKHRQRFWTTRSRSTVRAVSASCPRSYSNRRTALFVPPTADLPEDRLLHHHGPFYDTTLDCIRLAEVAIGSRRDPLLGSHVFRQVSPFRVSLHSNSEFSCCSLADHI